MDACQGRRIGLVGCVKEKAPSARRAEDLYTSKLFRGRVTYAEKYCGRWFILSALHGVVDPDTVLEPYDATLDNAPRERRRVWSRQVLEQLRAKLGDLGSYAFEIHAGAPYRDFGLVEGLRGAGAVVVNPTEGLRIGQQLSFYAKARS